MTCRVLYTKCLHAQRLKEVHFGKIIVSYNETEANHSVSLQGDWSLSEDQFRASNFRFTADEMIFRDNFETACITKVLDLVCGRGSVKELVLDVGGVAAGTDPALFVRLLQELRISMLYVESLPTDFWQLAIVKQLTEFHTELFQLPLLYLNDASVETCSLEIPPSETSSAELNAVLQKWAAGEKKIKNFGIRPFDFREEELFKEFHVVDEEDIQPEGRPLVVRAQYPVGEKGYTVERSDGMKLYVEFYATGRLALTETSLYDDSEINSDMAQELREEMEEVFDWSGNEEDYEEGYYDSDDSYPDMQPI